MRTDSNLFIAAIVGLPIVAGIALVVSVMWRNIETQQPDRNTPQPDQVSPVAAAPPQPMSPRGNATAARPDATNGTAETAESTEPIEPPAPAKHKAAPAATRQPPSTQHSSGPRALRQHATAYRDRVASVFLCGESEDGEPLNFEIVSKPSHGFLRPIVSSDINAAVVRYAPRMGYTGSDQFTYVVSDGSGTSPPARVELMVRESPMDVPECCPHVWLDAHGRLMIEGSPVFLRGFWAIYRTRPIEGWRRYAESFNALVTGATKASRNSAMDSQGLHLLGQSGLRMRRGPDGQRELRADRVREHACDRSIVAWEVYHELNYNKGLAQDVEAQATAIRDADPCDRPVFVTPSAGAGSFFADCAPHVDLIAVQLYPTPHLPIKMIASHIARVQSRIGDTPFVYVYSIAGYQPQRYRYLRREPTGREIRTAAYLGWVHGATGVLFYPYSKGGGDTDELGVEELNDSRYCVADSRDHYATIQRISRELQQREALLSAPRATFVAKSDSDDIFTTVRDLNGELPGGAYVVCVNAAETPSPYFFQANGERAMQLRAHVLTADGTSFPVTDCIDGRDNDRDGKIDLADSDCTDPSDETEQPKGDWQAVKMKPRRLYIKRVTTGVTDAREHITTARVHFREAASDIRYRIALYADDNRDLSPDRQLDVSPWRAVPDNGGWAEHTFPHPIPLEHTKAYFLLMQVDGEGVVADMQDRRYGAQPRNDTTELLPEYPPLFAGRAVQATISLEATEYEGYRLVRAGEGSADARPFESGGIVADFSPYAVHVYQLLRREGP